MERRQKILVVEDDESFRESVRKLLEKEGFEVLEASSGEEGVNVLDRNPVDLIILDLYLGGMTGLEFLDQTNKPGRPPVVMLTAFGDWGIYADALGRGVFDCIAKPVKKNDLMAVVSGALEKRSR